MALKNLFGKVDHFFCKRCGILLPADMWGKPLGVRFKEGLFCRKCAKIRQLKNSKL